jgi:chemotaxis protein histidine kinase CheA
MKDPMLISIFLDELKTALGSMAGVLSSADAPQTAEELQKIVSSLKGSAKLAGLELVFLLLSEFETVLAKFTASSRGMEPNWRLSRSS